MSSEYSFIEFTKKLLSEHTNVTSVQERNDYVFEVTRSMQEDKVVVVIVNEYVLGELTILRIIQENPDVAIICSGGDWNKPTKNAFDLCSEHNVCLCNFKGLYWVLFKKNCRNYVCDTYC